MMGRLVSIVSHSCLSLMIIASVSHIHVHGVNICLAQCLKCETASRRGLLRDYELSRGHSFEALVRAGGCSPHVLTNLSTQLVIRKLVHTCKSDVSSLPNSTVGLRRTTSAKNICLKRKKKYLHWNSEYLCLKFFILLSVHILNISTDIYLSGEYGSKINRNRLVVTSLFPQRQAMCSTNSGMRREW